MKNQTLVALEKTLADSYLLMLKTQNYHWNITGENFKPLHELFGAQYEELFEAIDEIAERIRALGARVDGNFESFSKLSKIKAADKNSDAKTMIKNLIVDSKELVKSLKNSVKISQNEGDEASADMLIERIQVHEKAIWMLESSK